jgi:hypothetical protein
MRALADEHRVAAVGEHVTVGRLAEYVEFPVKECGTGARDVSERVRLREQTAFNGYDLA